jgi:hypothetical protein
MNIQSYNPILRSQVESFKSTGHLSGEGQRQDIPNEAVPKVKAQLTEQMDQVIFADNTQVDQDPEVGKVLQDIPDWGMRVKAEFEGNTSVGQIALDANVTGMETSAYAEFTSSGALIIQSISQGGEPGFVGVHLDYAGGQSYMETLNVPDGFSVGI